MSTLLNRLRRNPKPKPLLKQNPASVRCVDSCCYENTACTVEPIATSSRQSRSARSSGSEIKDASGRPILRRSDTFTLKDGPPDELPDHIKYATYRKKKKPTRDSIIEQDVFESLYTKRPIKTASPVQPQQSFPNALRAYPTPTPKVVPSPFHFTHTSVTPSVVRPSVIPIRKQPPALSRRSTNSSLVSHNSSKSSSPSIKPPEYLFGSLERTSARAQSPKSPPARSNTISDHDDRFRTITLRDVRRSFREKYLPNENSDDHRDTNKHLPIWFVDVTGGDKQPSSPVPASPRTSTDREAYRSLTYMEFIEPASEPIAERSRVTVNRQNTFKVLRPSDEQPPKATGVTLQRRETFKVHEPMVQPPEDSARGYYLNRYRQHIEPQSQRRQLSPTPPPTTDRFATKVIPIGIAVPYNSNNDRPEDHLQTPSPPLRRHRRSPSPQQRPQTISTATYTRKVHPKRDLYASDRPHSISSGAPDRPIGSKISFDALRKPVEQPKDLSKTNLGFDRFYDPNYFVPKNQNLFGPLATAQLRAINVVVQPKVRPERPVERKIWY